MRSGLRTIWYFTWRGLGYGAALGALGGSLAYPILGTFFGGAWGGFVGIALGLLLGIAAHFFNRRAYRQQLAFDDYQATLAMGAGLAATILSALPLAIIFAPIAGLTAAYVAHRYAEDNAQHIAKRKVEALQPAQDHMERYGVIGTFTNKLLGKMKWMLLLLSGLVGIAAFASGSAFVSMAALLVQSAIFGLLALLAMTLIVTGIGLANGIIIQFMNRLFFKQSMEKAAYKRAIVIFSAVFTLLISPVVTLALGAPIMALFAAWAAASYVDWYYDTRPKIKRGAQLEGNRAALDLYNGNLATTTYEDEWQLDDLEIIDGYDEHSRR